MHVVRKLLVVFVMGLLALTVACSSSSSCTSAAASGTGTAAAEAAGSCPTTNTVKFAKTKFVADAALAGGAFKRYIYTPAKDGKLKKGASGRVLALVKAAAAGAFVINRLKAAETAAQGNPTLCKVFVAPAREVHGRPDRAGRQGQERRHRPVGRRRRLQRADRSAQRGHLGRGRLHRQRQRQYHRLASAALIPGVEGTGVARLAADIAGDVLGGLHDLDGAALAPPVPFLLGRVLHGDRLPVQGVELVP